MKSVPLSDSDSPVALMRVAAIVEYDGTAFAGLQRQRDGATIQGAFEVMARQFGVDACHFRASGRTDAGVHARGQVITIDLPAKIARKNMVSAMNWHLPDAIRVRRAVRAPENFDPRRDARLRTYRYLLCGGQPFPPLMRDRMGRIKGHLRLDSMRAAAQQMEGEHDFRAWRSSQCQARRTVLHLRRANVEPWSAAAPHGMDAQCFELEFACRSFLHHMVRYLVGGIARAGTGELTPEALARHLRDGTLPPRVAPADASGLCLERVDYAEGKDPFR